MSTPSKVASPAAASLNRSKSSRLQKIIVLRLDPSLLKRFPVDATPKRPAKAKATPDTDSQNPDSPQSRDVKDEPDPSASNSPRPGDAPATNGKRKHSAVGNGRTKPDDGKPRAKAAPKRRRGLVEGEQTTQPSHKLGPKANQGAINDKLRALDRSGNPCRRWQRSGFSFSSFTGVKWELPQWNTAKLAALELNSDDVQSEKSGSSENDQGGPASSIVHSEKSVNGVAEPLQPPADPATSMSVPPSETAVES